MKQIEVSPAVYDILHELSMIKGVKPDMLAKSLVKEEYKKNDWTGETGKFSCLVFCCAIFVDKKTIYCNGKIVCRWHYWSYC